MSKSVFRVRALVVALAALFLVVGVVPPSQAAEPAPPQPVLASSTATTCAVRENQRVYCWGGNNYGQLGRSPSDLVDETPVPIAGNFNAVAVYGGGNTFCALLIDRTVSCWGAGTDGQLGNGANDDSPVPVAVSGLTNVASLAVGSAHVCAVRQDGSVWCWGWNPGTLFPGHGMGTYVLPVKITGISSAIGIASGGDVSCALKVDRTVWCWGENSYLNAGAPAGAHAAPTQVTGLTGVVQISANTFRTCAVRSTGTVACWGSNEYGGLGALASADSSATPLTVWRLTGAKEVAVGYLTTCARTSTAVKCWGYGEYGALGDSQRWDASAPVTALFGLEAPTSISVGVGVACEVASAGGVWCWGRNETGEVGNGTTDIAYQGDGPEHRFGLAASREVIPLLNPAPGTPTGSSTLAHKIKISWAAPSTANGTSAPTDYVIQYKLKGTTTWKTFTDSVTATRSVTVSGLTTGKYYQFRVYPKNWAGTGSVSLASGYIKSK